MDPRVSMITLGVADVDKAAEFYEQVVGWKVTARTETFVCFDLGGIVFSLYPHSEMVKEWNQTLDETPSYRGFALAHNLASEQEVDALFAELRSRGAKIVKEPERVFWGGYSGYFEDVDGNKWEVAHNPHWTMDEQGRIQMPVSD